jgi:CDP-4-dehydro-6-deoxyglucose reductase, E3
MPTVTYAGVPYALAPGEAVLDTLLRNGLPIANSCRAGACQSCLLRAVGGPVPAIAQRGLKATLVEQGYFLSCVCLPETDLRIEPAGGLEIEASIASIERLTSTVLRARLRLPAPLEYRAGQYVTLRRPDGLARSYSLASLPDEDTLELHVRLAPHGRMSGWLFNEAQAGHTVTVRGPAGDCFYTKGSLEQPLLMIGTGTGLAPLAGICRDALRQGHLGPIHLYHGARSAEGLYLQGELRALSTAYANFRYDTVVPEGDGLSTADAIAKLVAKQHPALKGWRGFICGNPPAVSMLKKKMFMAGMPAREIFTDAFLEAPKPKS